VLLEDKSKARKKNRGVFQSRSLTLATSKPPGEEKKTPTSNQKENRTKTNTEYECGIKVEFATNGKLPFFKKRRYF